LIVAGAALVVALVLVNIVLVEMNRSLQADVNGRQQFIQQSVQLEALNREIVSAIANLSVRNQDDALKTVLSQHGITFTPSPAGTAAPQPPAPSTAPKRPGS
jgi:hypothetical protein